MSRVRLLFVVDARKFLVEGKAPAGHQRVTKAVRTEGIKAPAGHHLLHLVVLGFGLAAQVSKAAAVITTLLIAVGNARVTIHLARNHCSCVSKARTRMGNV